MFVNHQIQFLIISFNLPMSNFWQNSIFFSLVAEALLQSDMKILKKLLSFCVSIAKGLTNERESLRLILYNNLFNTDHIMQRCYTANVLDVNNAGYNITTRNCILFLAASVARAALEITLFSVRVCALLSMVPFQFLRVP